MNMIRSFAWAGTVSILVAGMASAASQAKSQQGTTQPSGTQPGGVQKGTAQSGTQGSIMQTPWFSNPDIRQQFKFNDETYNRLNSSYKDAWGRYQKGVSQLDKNLSDEKRQQSVRDLQHNFYKDLSTASDSAISDPQQRQRYNQLYWQYRGYGAFEDPTVAERLKLTAEQREKLSGYSRDWSKQMNDLGPTFQSNREDATKRFSKMQGEAGERINSVLTPEQQKSWRQMTGEQYHFQPNVYFQTSGTTNNQSNK